MTYGLDDTGFNAATFDDILAEINSDLLAEISATLNLSPSGELGVVGAIVAKRISVLWEALQDVWSAGDPAEASGRALDVLCAITGTLRAGPVRSLIRGAQLTLGASRTVPAGSIACVTGDTTARFRTRTSVVSTTAGTYTVDLESVAYGAVHANAGTLTTIVTPADGWTAITNPTDAVLGNLGETDAALRIRRENELAAAGTGTCSAIRSRLLRYTLADGTFPIAQASVRENVTNSVDVNGLPAHSVEAIVHDPDPLSNNAMAQVLWDNGVAAGIATYGLLSGVATDSEDRAHTVLFSRATSVPIVLEVTLKTDDSTWPTNGVTLVREALQTYSFEQGVYVYRSQLYPSILTVDGIRYIVSVRAARSGSALADADVTIAVREIATVQASDITVILT